ncbi:uncharacterized protein LOC128954450 [Oppia nitens]|uniref:uncharacterized protein LOC128954450 n=1 Tax=Oppia nitens TaxID=1686743 RepID=UPI0023DA058C|nr:uncharacterized protein LOC128954450 [Oppia nitens]
MRAYDGQFILKEMINMGYKDIEITPRAKLPKAFGLNVELKKGTFPHKYNKPKNYNSVLDKLPDKKYFGCDYMTKEQQIEFNDWYDSFIGIWSFKQELITYCMNDCEILLQAIQKYRQTFKEITGLDPITRNFTLASVAMECFKANFLQEKQIANTPVCGYDNYKNKSDKERIWIEDIIKKDKILKNGLNIERNARLGSRYWPDGLDREKKIVYEFFGCYYHGCVTCFPLNRDEFKPNIGGTFNEKYNQCQQKIAYYERRGFKVEFEWEHDFDYAKVYYRSTSDEVSNSNNYKKSIDIKDAFFGGRTNNLRYNYVCKDDEEIKYLDFCSLYPYVLKYKQYPIGHPKVITCNFPSIKDIFGIVKCRIKPNASLYLPVLPSRINNKLLFTLCETCAENNLHCECFCENKSIIGTWTSIELQLAIKHGYVIEQIFEIHQYETTSSDLFKHYINMWLKIKQEASGWPDFTENIIKYKNENATITSDDILLEMFKVNYINDYKVIEDIDLDYDKIEKNESLRFIAKLMLNSFWGKFAQKPNQPQTQIISSYDEYEKLWFSEDKEIVGHFKASDDVTVLSWQYLDDKDSKARTYNVTIAAFVTAYARIELYNLLDRIEKNRINGKHSVLYYDTDSVIYLRNLNDPIIETGNYLGNLTDEINVSQEYITSIVDELESRRMEINDLKSELEAAKILFQIKEEAYRNEIKALKEENLALENKLIVAALKELQLNQLMKP